ncbi:MAG: hypothetical protein LUH02_12145 [Erysipelotrichaceae bacterium]|nr:hypothetical protein [Erysipelotrichaceae bacterium]
MNQSIMALEQLQETINQASQNATASFQQAINRRDEVVNQKREQFHSNYQQLQTQIHLEKENFSNFKIQYEKIEKRLDATQKQIFEQQMRTIKEQNIQEYKEVLSHLYDLNNSHDKAIYDKTVNHFSTSLINAQTAFDCNKYLRELEETQKLLSAIDEDSWIKNNNDIKKAQEDLNMQVTQIGTDLENAIKKDLNNKITGQTIGQLLIKNEYLDEWPYQENILNVLKDHYENKYLKITYKDMLNDYMIEGDKTAEIFQLLEFSTLIESIKKPIHIYYDYHSTQSLISSLEYKNCEKIIVNDTFISQLKEEIKQLPHQSISLFIDHPIHCQSFEEFIQTKPNNVQIVMFQNNQYQDFIYINGKDNRYILNNQYDFFANKINEKGLQKLHTSQPKDIQVCHIFEKYYEEHYHDGIYLIAKDKTIDFHENFVVVSNNQEKRISFITQLLLQRISENNKIFIYYNNYENTPLRSLINDYNLQEIELDMMGELMEDFLDDHSLVVLIDPSDEVLGFAMTLFDMGHILVCHNDSMEGYKNLLLDENIIEEYGKQESIQFELLNQEKLEQLCKL